MFNTICTEVRQRVVAQDTKVSTSGPAARGRMQLNGTQPQDSIQFDQKKTEPALDAYACPNADYRHVGTSMALSSTEYIAKVNAKTKANHLNALASQNQNKKGKKKKKAPPMGRLLDQQIGCFYFLFFCRFFADGGNCPNCQKGRADMYQVLDGDGKPHCTCDICNCNCFYVFNQNERHKFTAKNLQEQQQRQMQYGDEMKIDNSTNLFYSSMYGMM